MWLEALVEEVQVGGEDVLKGAGERVLRREAIGGLCTKREREDGRTVSLQTSLVNETTHGESSGVKLASMALDLVAMSLKTREEVRSSCWQ